MIGFRYATKYDCRHAFCYDGEHLLMLRWQCREAQQMVGTRPDVWVIEFDAVERGRSTTLRYALYLLIKDGYRRVQSLPQ